MKTPSSLGYKMPPEWEKQKAVWMSWAHNGNHWQGDCSKMKNKLAEIIATISLYQEVRINISKDCQQELWQFISPFPKKEANIICYDHQTNDVWCRDHGPIFLKQETSGNIAISDWGFNAWGGKFPPWNLDNDIPKKISTIEHTLPYFKVPMILEGGSIEVNGTGDLLTTESVLLNPNRNPHLNKAEIEKFLKDVIGCKRIHWLKNGIAGDDTDGHIDDLIRFVNDNTLVITTEKDCDDENYPVLTQLKEDLYRIIADNNFDWEVIPIPMPKACNAKNWRLDRLPASYANFLIINEAVLLPVFDQPTDSEVLEIFEELFPHKAILPIDCNITIFEGGAIHCLTQQQPL